MNQAALNLEIARNGNLAAVLAQESMNKYTAEMNNIEDQNPEDELVAISSTDIAADGTNEQYTSASVNFVTEGVKIGQWINVSGFTTGANNGTFKVTNVASGAITVDTDLTTEAVGDTIVITCEEYRRTLMNTVFAEKNNLPASLLP